MDILQFSSNTRPSTQPKDPPPCTQSQESIISALVGHMSIMRNQVKQLNSDLEATKKEMEKQGKALEALKRESLETKAMKIQGLKTLQALHREKREKNEAAAIVPVEPSGQQIQFSLTDWKRWYIFKTMAYWEGMKFSLVIDSGASVNFVSDHVVEMLKLPRETLEKPFTFGWVENDVTRTVAEGCLVPFSIGLYADSAYCYVVPMLVNGLMLGRPWLHDRDVTCNGKENTYSFRYRGQEIVLSPSMPSNLNRQFDTQEEEQNVRQENCLQSDSSNAQAKHNERSSPLVRPSKHDSKAKLFLEKISKNFVCKYF